ncbi:histidine kinase [Micromonospora sp. NPDC049559]|uniref:sensor histidine kinase n=1 Tax=Micromonospora sp. NPDC049559 TaxID=3155923 RepID=UPI00342128FA
MWDEQAARIEAALRPSGPPPRPSPRGQLFDITFALVLAGASIDYAYDVPVDQDGADPVPLVVVALAAATALALRRRYPLTVLWAVLLLTLPVVGALPRVTYYDCVIAAYSATAYSPYRVQTLGTVGLLGLLAWRFTRDGMPTVPQHYVGSLVLALVVLAGLALRLWRSRAEQGQQRLAAAERERAEALRRAVESERARIARELHDVVTHNVSVMVIQAGAARRVIDSAPEQAREAMRAVEGAGRTAMTELRHVMGLLAAAGDDAALAPQPGLEQLEALVGRVRETGMPVAFSVTGRPRPVPAGEALAAYRVVQEALTNAVKHASGASAAVRLHYGDDELRVEVTDDGGRATGAGGSGRGLLGLRERLAVYGGTLRSGPQLTGDGYRVDAVIPLGMP